MSNFEVQGHFVCSVKMCQRLGFPIELGEKISIFSRSSENIKKYFQSIFKTIQRIL